MRRTCIFHWKSKMWINHRAVCPTLRLILHILHSPVKPESTLKVRFMYSYSRQNFSYLGNRLAATHKGRSQKISPVLVYRSVGKMIEAPETEEQLSKERCDNVSLPIRQPSAFQAAEPFQLVLLMQLLRSLYCWKISVPKWPCEPTSRGTH